MTPLGWLALAGAAAVVALPGASAGRVERLRGSGRLRPATVRPGGWRRVPLPTLPSRVLAGSAVGVVALAVGAWVGPALAVAAAGVVATGLVLARDALRRRAAAGGRRDVLTAVRVLAGELTAGARPGEALTAASATSTGAGALLATAAGVAARGGDASVPLVTSDDAGVRALGAAWRLVESSGAALAEVVERVAADLAGADTRDRTVAVALAGPRASALLVSGLPVIGIGLGLAMGARPLDFLLADPIGRVLCCAGVLLDVAGILWIRAVVARAERP